jgi:hypothetical protein
MDGSLVATISSRRGNAQSFNSALTPYNAFSACGKSIKCKITL